MTLAPEWRRAVAAVEAGLGLQSPEVSALPGGPANRVLRLRDARQDVVLRIAPPQAGVLGASIVAECEMQALAAGAGLAPEILMARPEQGWLAARHAPGAVLTRDDLRDTRKLARLGAWMAQLHALPVPRSLPFVDFGERAASCLARLGDPAAGEAAEIARRLRARRAALPPARPVACHHDLHHRNLIDQDGRLLAVDWEYAGPGDAAADLAACAGYHDLGPRHVDALLGGYGADAAPLRARLAALGWIFDCLWYGWNAVAAREGLAPAAEPGLQARLAARLLA